jgi:NADPH-dependent 2,4-dienoyl-CoA reductase/sulfur reductase-like enzyme
MMPKSSEIVILGNGGAACHAAMTARQTGFEGTIHMVSNVNEAAFNPMLGPYYLKGKIAWENCFPFGVAFYKQHHLSCHFGSPVTELDAENRSVTCDDGKKLRYDKCLIATGADPTFPFVPGLAECKKAFPVRNSKSIQQLEAAMKDAGKLVILGASLVGIKLAEIMKLKNPDAEILLVDVTEQVMCRGAHPVSAEYLRQYFEQQGISILLGCSLEGLEDDGNAVCCFFPESLIQKADFIAVCTGIRSNISFVNRDQVKIDLGILIDKNSQTSVDGLYAAGDCAQGFNPLSGKREWLGTWGNACYQGRAAGFHMAGKKSGFLGNPPQHISPFFDWTYVQMGDSCPQGEDVRIETSGNPFEGAFRLLVFENDILIGANLINDAQSIAPIKHAILQKKKGPVNLETSLMQLSQTGNNVIAHL